MYQIGISSNEPAPSPQAEMQENGAPAINFAQIEKSSKPKEALAKLMDNDFKFEKPPAYHGKIALLAVTVLAVGSISYYEFSKPDQQYTMVLNNKEIAFQAPTPTPVINQEVAPGQNLGVDYTLTGSVTKPAKSRTEELVSKVPIIAREFPNQRIHLVKAGDTLYEIAKKFGTTVKDLVADNAIKDPSRLKLKTKIIIR